MLLLDVHHLGEPRQRVLDAGGERGETDALEATVGDIVDIGHELIDRETDGVHGQAVADKFFFELDRLGHEGAQFFLELGGPDLAVLLDEIHEEIAEDLDVVGFVAERVAEHLADAGKLVLTIKREDHAEEAVELGALHALAENEDVFRQELLVLGLGEIDVAAEGLGDAGDELVLANDCRDILEHRLALVRVDAKGGDHVEQGVGVDVLLVRMAAQDELELGGGDEFADDVLDVVADDALGGRKVADAHADDPTLDIGNGLLIAPLLDVLAHRDVLGLPVVGLHLAVKIVGPLVFKGEQVEAHGLATIDDFFGGKRGLGFVLIEDEGLGTDLEDLLHGTGEGKGTKAKVEKVAGRRVFSLHGGRWRSQVVRTY